MSVMVKALKLRDAWRTCVNDWAACAAMGDQEKMAILEKIARDHAPDRLWWNTLELTLDDGELANILVYCVTLGKDDAACTVAASYDPATGEWDVFSDMGSDSPAWLDGYLAWADENMASMASA